MQDPLWKAVRKYQKSDPARFHIPCHKGSSAAVWEYLSAGCDVTELSCTDSLFQAHGVIFEAERYAARFFRTDATLFSAGGTTLCIQAMLKLVYPGGGKLIAGRNIHQSAVHTFAFLDILPVWLYPEKDRPDQDRQITPAQVEKAILENPEAKAVYITSPDYYGRLCKIGEIAEITRKYGIYLLLDAAHGTHLRLLSSEFDPIKLGADLICESAFKTVPGLTGGAFLHLNHLDFKNDHAKEAMACFASTSPSYLVLLSIGFAVDWMKKSGPAEENRLVERLGKLKMEIEKLGYSCLKGDPARLSVCVGECGMNGKKCAAFLEELGIYLEYADQDYLVAVPAPFNREQDFCRLYDALKEMRGNTERFHREKTVDLYPVGKMALTPRQAMQAETEVIPVSEAEGRISAQIISKCPPGIPMILPGEYLENAHLPAISIDKIRVVK